MTIFTPLIANDSFFDTLLSDLTSDFICDSHRPTATTRARNKLGLIDPFMLPELDQNRVSSPNEVQIREIRVGGKIT